MGAKADLVDLNAKARMLDAAELLFAERGFTATTIKDIAVAASVNSALLYYYFDSKERLYQACLERFVMQLADSASERIDASAAPDDIVRGIVAAQAAMMIRKPHLPKLIVREMVDWQASHAASALSQLSERMFRRLQSAIESGQASGHYRRGVDPTFAALSVISQVAYLVIARPLIGIVLGKGSAGIRDEDVCEFAQHAADFAIAALRPITGNASMPNADRQRARASNPLLA